MRVLSKKIVSKALKSFFETTQIEFSILQKPKKEEAMHFGDYRKYMIVVCTVVGVIFTQKCATNNENLTWLI